MITPLHLACANGHTDVVLFLIEQQCKINVQDSENKSPLIKAVQCQNEDCATILLNCGADPDLRDIRYNTALHYAVCGQSLSLVEKLLEYEADIEAKNKDGYTPLLVAVINNDPKMVKFLLEKGADVNASDNYQRTALILAVSGEPACLVKLLLQQGVELYYEGICGFTAEEYVYFHGFTVGEREEKQLLMIKQLPLGCGNDQHLIKIIPTIHCELWKEETC
ncbi:ankyrin repeat domain-containing protein 7 isoform X3 [Pongo pygmaeus]|uniref:ankyrin repeat domain-containing protein 7 isoform X3 n=1 Tax=Pongo pygmaeus TaxID=9600 RepID=UPI0023E19A9A|nr:ankyrin repeat domain-containing protein 7 isoform X3 [Pongo pygmaeus]XP_054350412.1 ankyrin repeat domain-containing protein 7 isoform X3 [Pongo pygmaeus]XP_054350413.1 ankyrin repeat domain-containing protein 7 isoform X3 [Pongo pygmaeus]